MNDSVIDSNLPIASLDSNEPITWNVVLDKTLTLLYEEQRASEDDNEAGSGKRFHSRASNASEVHVSTISKKNAVPYRKTINRRPSSIIGLRRLLNKNESSLFTIESSNPQPRLVDSQGRSLHGLAFRCVF